MRSKTWAVEWQVEKWGEDACEFTRRRLEIPRLVGVSSAQLLEVVGAPDEILVVSDNLLLNTGIQRMLDLLIGAGGTAYDAADSYMGVGDTATAEAATQTELQGTADPAHRFYKAMNATFPSRASQTVTWQADFTTAEANFHWQEWGVSAGASSASGSGFLVATKLLNRKTGDFGTKATGTWTFSGSVTIS